ncbi:Protein of unknown function (DUF3007) [Seminavis robusta]|uniref:Uncharacterized protein n=1 Tax=Seminavis robusta TaxID=568900 RepID=A0A9N8H8Y5_9STRA|nr:Protein of unknown function (DUF3007) [Seminavis robusta]|eukprot:Sro103_g052270.1 Protein of unknown function (DUF3007) (207) ;mRNA; r:1142-1969
MERTRIEEADKEPQKNTSTTEDNMYRSNKLISLGVALLAVALLSSTANGFVAPSVVIPRTQNALQRSLPTTTQQDFWQREMAADSNNNDGKAVEENKLPFYLDPGTKGGAIFLSLVAFVVPILFYEFVTVVFGVDGLEAGKWIGGGFTVLATAAWVGSYIFRVATKDMTYAKQLKDYENAVIAKRLEELDEDELQALVEEVERDSF